MNNSVKPPNIGKDFEWLRKGVGWDLRRVYFTDGKRHRQHIGHLGRAVLQQLQATHPVDALPAAIVQHFAEKFRTKGVTITNA